LFRVVDTPLPVFVLLQDKNLRLLFPACPAHSITSHCGWVTPPPHPTIYSFPGTFFPGLRFMMMLTRGENLKVLLFEKL
jgi:hypothetical protein